jgi:signal transduction histidine kinase
MNGSNRVARMRRSRRDWLADAGLFLVAVVYGLVWSAILRDDPTVTHQALVTQQVVAAVGCAALWLRRRWPVALALALVPLASFTDLVDGAQLVALFTVALHRPLKVALAVAAARIVSEGLAIAVHTASTGLRDAPDVVVAWVLAYTVSLTLAVVGWGLFIRHRRQLVQSLRDRAARAETEARLRAEQAQLHAREQIAREMHDVLGHRLSLLSLHAGALEYRPDAPPAEVARAAKVIRETTHQALQDLREVLDVLRAPDGELPQPTLADVRELVAESSRAGMRVELREETAGTVPDRLGRTAYRVVQEALTNIRKHAPGSDVRVRLTGARGQGLTVEVGNTAPAQAPVPGGGAGQGLVGLAERVSLGGGRLEHGPAGGGGWRLAAWLPWRA